MSADDRAAGIYFGGRWSKAILLLGLIRGIRVMQKGNERGVVCINRERRGAVRWGGSLTSA